jgi:hypothetical protein
MSKPQVKFLPGCFDHFEGTQEELDQIMAEILRMAESGELEHLGQAVDLESLTEQEQDLLARVEQMENLDPARTLH